MAVEFIYQGNKKIPIGEAMKDPALKEMAEAFLHVESHPWIQYDTQKYVALQRKRIREKIARFREDQPFWMLKDVLAALVKDFPAGMSPEQVLKFTKLIVKEWKKAQEAVVV